MSVVRGVPGRISVVVTNNALKRSSASPWGSDAENFSRRCQAGAAFRDRIVEHGGHPRPNGAAIDWPGARPRAHERAHVVSCFEDLEHAGTPAVASVTTPLASARPIHGLVQPQPKHCVARICRKISFG